MKKIFYVILHGSMNPNRYSNITETWAKNSDYLFYSDHEDIEKKIIKVSNRKDYNSNEEKHVNIIKYLYENLEKYKYEWFFFCDDDTFVNTKKLEGMLGTLDKNSVHGSLLEGTWPKDPFLRYCSGGAGYLISIDLLKTIGEKIRILNSGYSDVTLGILLRDLKISSINYDYFRSQPPSFYAYKNEEIPNYITFHYIKTFQDMDLMNKICYNN
jgi:hypothetical protein